MASTISPFLFSYVGVKIKTTLGAEYIERQNINYSMEYAKFKGKE